MSASSSPLLTTSTSGLWRTADPVLDDLGHLRKGGMFVSQREWWDLKNFIRLFVGGYGSGKTLQLCKRMLSLALHNAPAPVAIVSPTYGMAEETVILTMIELLDGKKTLLGKDGFDWYDKKKSPYCFYVFYHGRKARILVYSGDIPVRLKGTNLAAAGIDEPFIQDEAVFHQMIARVRHPDARRLEINLAGTPEQLNWGYDLAEGELGEKHDVGVVRGSTRENLVVGPEYVPRLESSFTGKAALAFVEGHFVDLAMGQVYYAFNRHENVVELSMPPAATLGVGMDFNVDPMAAVVFWHHGKHLHVVAEIELPNSDTEEMCNVLRDTYGVELNDVYPDATGQGRGSMAAGGVTDHSIIEDHGFEIRVNRTVRGYAENPRRRDRYNSVNGKFKPRRGRLSLTISPTCKKLIKYLSIYSHENMNKLTQKAMSHLLDAFTYPVAYLFPIHRDRVVVKRLIGA